MNYKDNNQSITSTEKFILGIYTIYAISISFMAYSEAWSGWGTGIILISYFTVLIAMIARYGNLYIRSMILTVGICIVIFYRGVFASDLNDALPTIYLMCTCIAMLGVIEEIALCGLVTIAMEVRYLAGIAHAGKDQSEIIGFVFQLLGTVLFILVLYIWVKNRVRNQEVGKNTEMEKNMAENSRDSFLANVSHEIRTPLNVINSISETLDPESGPEIIREELHNIRIAAKRLIFMTSDIRDFSELFSGQSSLEEEAYSLSTSVQDIIDMAVAAIDSKKIELFVELDVKLPDILKGDEKKIRRIILNFIDNAVKFTDSGYITLTVKGRPEAYGYNLIFSVTDTGIGMSEESIERILEGYDRIGTTRTKQGEGIGLGMAISKLLAKTLGGVITINSQQGVGSTFTLVVPQKVVDDKKIVSLDKADSVKACYYLDFEKYESKAVRDFYSRLPNEIADNLGVDAHMCINVEDLKNRVIKSKITHIFVGRKEYLNDREYYDNLIHKRIRVVVCADDNNYDDDLSEYGVLVIEKPYYSLKIAQALFNNTIDSGGQLINEKEEFRTRNVVALVVDDNKMNIHVVENLLKKYDIRVEGVLSGAEALDKVNSMKYDVIFMDHMMPEMDGVETTHRIREKFGEYFQRVPIVALTANAIAGSREMYLKEGFSDFMEKPVEPSVMERVLKRVIQQDKQVMAVARKIEVVERKMETKDILANLDVETGLMYCGGEENYGAILAECVLSFNDTLKDLEDSYNSEDYSLYVIKIHGLKSTMKSIGAMELSEKARLLEMAGKAGEYNTIKEGHREVMNEYYDTMNAISEYAPAKAVLGAGFIFTDYATSSLDNSAAAAETVVDDNLKELSGDDFEEIKKNFENAMYSLDEDIMKAIVDEIKNYRVGKVSLAGIAEKMGHKIDMGDFFSAGDLLFNVKED